MKRKLKLDPNLDFAAKLEEALVKQDRNKMTVSELHRLVLILEERSKRDR